MKAPAPFLVVLFRLYCVYIAGMTLYSLYTYALRVPEEILWDVLTRGDFLGMELSIGILLPCTLLYCSLKPSYTSLILIHILFGAKALYGAVNAVKYFSSLTERFGMDAAYQIFPIYVAANQVAALLMLLFLLGNRGVKRWFVDYGMAGRNEIPRPGTH